MRKCFVAIVISAAFALNSMAALIDPVLPGAYVIPPVLAPGAWTLGTEPAGPEWYKANWDGNTPSAAEEGLGAPYFTTVFGQNTADPKEFAQIFWDSSVFTPSITAVYLKIGGLGGSGAYVHLDISGVDLSAYSSILAWNPDPTTAISHIRITGEGEGNGVPDGGSMLALLGASLAALGFLRRKLAV